MNFVSGSNAKPGKSFSISPKLTLQDCYGLALKQSEYIAIDAEKIKEADARFLQALSIMLPHVSFLSDDLQEAQPTDAGTTFASLKPTKSSVRRFNMTQTLFSGFKAFAAMKGSRGEKDQRIKEKIRAEQLLLVDVANAFYLLIEKREDLKAMEQIRRSLKDRIKELRARENLGRSRPSEVVNAKAQLHSIESSLEVIKSQEIVAKNLLEFLVGMPVNELIDSYQMPDTLKPESYYVAKSDMRPDVEAAKYAWEVSKSELAITNSDFLPKADINTNYYVQRTGFNKGTDWDVTLKISVPIFEGTEVLGRSKEAEAKMRESELTFLRTKRNAPYNISDAYTNLRTGLSVRESLRKEYTTAKLNFYLQKKDYERSLVSNLDVLAAIQTLRDAQRDYIHALYETKRLYWQLRVAVGQSVTESLNDTF